MLASSPQGIVELSADGARWDSVFGLAAADDDVRIRPDLSKLDLKTWRAVSLDQVRASDSGRIAGPKAANLGELKHLYGEAVPRGVVIPFGAFRHLLEQPRGAGGPSVFEWMRGRYAAIRSEPDSARQREATRAFLAELRQWIENADPGPEFREDLAKTMETTFGADGTYGVFVRSDTNVEDLPGFTGAGLNLTLPNVVGFTAVVDALGKVWASPFSERSYAWRQSLMDEPEYVFPGVVLLESFASEKSGVLVTVDVDTGASGWLSVATSEGVGGAVEGQAAEELRIRTDGGAVRLLSQATAPEKARLVTSGGVEYVAASGGDRVLHPGEIAHLVELAADLPARFASLREGDKVIPADIEFAFRDGRLALLQVRPFVESKRARRSAYLQSLDRRLSGSEGRLVDLDAPPLPNRGGQ